MVLVVLLPGRWGGKQVDAEAKQYLVTSERYMQWVWVTACGKELGRAMQAPGWFGEVKDQTLHSFGWPQGWEVD